MTEYNTVNYIGLQNGRCTKSKGVREMMIFAESAGGEDRKVKSKSKALPVTGRVDLLRIGSQMEVRLSALRIGRALLPNNIICLLLVPFLLEAE
jgi:hypothetical protein